MKLKIKVLLISLLLICASSTVSNAAIEIKEGGKYHTGITASDAFDYCKNMDSTSTLGNNNLDPHMALNADWGACAYLAFSGYGTCGSYGSNNKSDGNYGPKINMNGKTYYTTTSNITGVMNMGGTYGYGVYSYTASLLEGAETNDNMKSLVEYKNTKYVENITAGKTNGMAIDETLRLVFGRYEIS